MFNLTLDPTLQVANNRTIARQSQSVVPRPVCPILCSLDALSLPEFDSKVTQSLTSPSCELSSRMWIQSNTSSSSSSQSPATPPPSSSASLTISAPLVSGIIKADFVSLRYTWWWVKKFVVLAPPTLCIYRNEKVDGGPPQTVIVLENVINLKREATKDYCFSLEIRSGKRWLFSFKKAGEFYEWMEQVHSVATKFEPFWNDYNTDGSNVRL